MPNMFFQIINLKELEDYDLKPFWVCPECFLKIPIKEFEDGHYVLYLKYIPSPIQGQQVQIAEKLGKDFTIIREARADGNSIVTETKVVDDLGNLKQILKPPFDTAKISGVFVTPSEETYRLLRNLVEIDQEAKEKSNGGIKKQPAVKSNEDKKPTPAVPIKEKMSRAIYRAFPNFPKLRRKKKGDS